MFLYFLIFYIPTVTSYLERCQEYSSFNKTNYNVMCFTACEKLEQDIYSLNCTELYNYSEKFLNVCFTKDNCDNDMLNVYYDLNKIIDNLSCKKKLPIKCNLNNNINNSFNVRIAYIILILMGVVLLLCTIFHCRKGIYSYYIERNVSTLETRFVV